MSLPLVSIIVLNYNGGEILIDCILSIMNSHYPQLQIIIVDNGSTDNSFKIAQSKYKQYKNIEFIATGKNTGFSIGNFVGLKHAKGYYIVLLNNDVIVDPCWLDELLKEANKNDRGFYQPKILLLDNPTTIDTVGNAISMSGICYSNGFGELDDGKYDGLTEIAYASGACVLTSRKVIDEIGFLDLDYFAFGEDADWGWRGKMFGIKSYYVPSSKVYHKWGNSWGRFSKKKLFLVERNRLITLLKNYSSNTLLVLMPLLSIVELSVLGYSLRNGWLSNKMLMYSDIFKFRNNILKQRRLLQSQRTISDREVVETFSQEVHLYNSSYIQIFNKATVSLVKKLRPLIK